MQRPLSEIWLKYLKEFAKSYCVAIEAVEQTASIDPNEEMANDLISVVTCFSARIYGARGGKKLKKALDELECERREAVTANENNN